MHTRILLWLTNPQAHEIAVGIKAGLLAAGAHPAEVIAAEDLAKPAKKKIPALTHPSVDGSFVIGPIPETSKVWQWATPPVVTIGIRSSRKDVSAVLLDWTRASADAVRHFHEQGLHCAAYLGHMRAPQERAAHRIFQRITRAAGLKTGSRAGNRLEDPDALCRWLGQFPEPTGIVVPSRNWIPRLTEACRRLHLSIPRDIAILTLEPPTLAHPAPFPSYIVVPYWELGRVATEVLATHIKTGAPVTRLVAPGRTVVRESSNRHAAIHPSISDALALMNRRVSVPMTAASLANELQVSWHTLNKRFLRVLGHSVHDEIATQQLRVAQHLLLTTDHPIKTIALRVGHTRLDNFSRFFHRHTGLAPSAFRARFHPCALKK